MSDGGSQNGLGMARNAPDIRAFLGAGRAELMLNAAAAIRNDVLTQSEPLNHVEASLVCGTAGVALFLAYYGITVDDDVAIRSGARLIRRAVELVQRGPTSMGLFLGVTGVAWVAEHLHRHLGVLKEDLIESSFDRELEDRVTTQNHCDRFDLFTGLAGVGVYALERYRARELNPLAEATVSSLSACSETDADGRFWRTAPSVAAVPGVTSERYANLGMPHGQAGVVALLARLQARLPDGAARATCGSLLEEAVAWLLAHEVDAPRGPRFGMSVGLGPHPRALPLAWCYSDLTVATALASVTTGPAAPRASECVRRLLSHCCKVTATAPIDATLCHGAAGTAHLFARLWQATGDPSAAHASAEWFDRALLMREPGGVGGFWGYRRKAWRADSGLLRGASGVGLAMLSAVSAVPPEWDRVLLMPSAE